MTNRAIHPRPPRRPKPEPVVEAPVRRRRRRKVEDLPVDITTLADGGVLTEPTAEDIETALD